MDVSRGEGVDVSPCRFTSIFRGIFFSPPPPRSLHVVCMREFAWPLQNAGGGGVVPTI